MSRLSILLTVLALAAGCDLFTLEPTPAEKAQALFNQGRQLLDQGSAEQAAQVLGLAAELDRNNGAILLAQGKALTQAGDQGQAIMALSRAAELLPQQTEPDLLLADLYEKSGKAKLALGHLQKALVKDKTNAGILKRQARLHIALGSAYDAERCLRQARKLVPEDVATSLLQAELFTRQGKHAKATATLREAAGKEPKDHRVRLALGRQLLAAEEVGPAIQELEVARDIQPDAEELGLLLGRAYLKAGRHDEAQIQLEATRKARPRDPHVRVALAELHLAKGQHEKALVEADGALTIQPGMVEAHMTMARIHMAQGMEAEAIQSLERAIEASPASVEPRLQLAAHYEDMGDRAKAIDQLESVLAHRPDDSVVKRELAEFYVDSGKNLETAAVYLDALLARTPDDQDLLALKTRLEAARRGAAAGHSGRFAALSVHKSEMTALLAKNQRNCKRALKQLKAYHRKHKDAFVKQKKLTQTWFDGLDGFGKQRYAAEQGQGIKAFATGFKNFRKSVSAFNQMARAAARRGKGGQGKFDFKKFRKRCPRQAKAAKKMLDDFNPAIKVPPRIQKKAKKSGLLDPKGEFNKAKKKHPFLRRYRMR